MKIYILLPAYNESANLRELIANLKAVLKKTHILYQIVIVNDGSIDDTDSILRQNFKPDSTIKIIKHPKNLGLGAAMNTGFTSILKLTAKDDLVIAMDADNTHDVSTIPTIIDKFNEGYDLILTSRFVPGGGDQGISYGRRLLSHQAGRIFQLLFPIRGVREYTSSYRGYRASLLKKAYEKYGENFIAEKGFNCMFEILVKLVTLRSKIIEVPTRLYYDRKKGKSKMDVKKTLWRYFIFFINQKLSFKIGR